MIKIYAIVSTEGILVQGGEDSPDVPRGTKLLDQIQSRFQVVRCVEHFKEMLRKPQEEDVYVYGDLNLMRLALPHAKQLHITRLSASIKYGERLFPRGKELRGWKVVSTEVRSGFTWEIQNPE